MVATGDTTLGAVIDEAAACFGVFSQNQYTVGEQVNCVAFFRNEDATGMEGDYSRWSYVIRTVATDGRLSWPVRWSQIGLTELVASAEAGHIDGDPLRPYFWPVIPQGDLVDIVSALWTFWMLWEHALSGRETIGLARTLLRRVRRAKAAAEQDSSSWERALARPQDYFAYLDESPRTTTEASRKLGLSPERTEGALWGMGYALGADGKWRPAADPASAALHDGLHKIERAGRAPTITELAEQLRAVMEAGEKSDDDSDPSGSGD